MPLVRRYITTHNNDGEAVFLSSSRVPECAPNRTAGDDGEVAMLYSTDTFPIQMDQEADVAVYDSYLHTPPGLMPQNGTVMRVVDMRPSKETPMHRTISLDYGVVLEGEVELLLDSGQSRVMRRGDVSIQRGTSHSYRNRSDTDWCRLLFVFLPTGPLTVGGKELKEEWYDEWGEEKQEEEKQGEKQEEGKQEEGKQEEEKQDSEKQEGENQEEGKQEEGKQEEKQEDGEQQGEKPEDQKQEDGKRHGPLEKAKSKISALKYS